MSGKNYDEEPGSTLDRCPQRAERNFPCKPKTFQLRWLGGGGRKRGCKSEQDGGKGYLASWGLGASLSYSVEGERLGGGPHPLARPGIVGLEGPSGVFSCIPAPDAENEAGPRPSVGTGLDPVALHASPACRGERQG